jgi:putative hydrolase of the HAD superfamily
MTQKSIKNIIFDYGNVIINLDIDATYRAFEELGAARFGEVWEEIMKDRLFQKYERGDISNTDFRNFLRKALPSGTSDEKIDQAWNEILKDMPASRIQLLDKIRNQYRTFILSNSNEIHYRHYVKDLQNIHHFQDFDQLVEKAYFSFQVNLAKPEAAFYQLVMNIHGLKPEETLFIDDLKQNIDAAAALGIQTLWLAPGMDICDLFDEKNQLKFSDQFTVKQ